jgi:rSAM/selenodomain-associated transferase 1
MNARCVVIVMAKAPVPGYAKTRLIPALGAVGAAQLAGRLLQHAVGAALQSKLGLVDLCCAPDRHHPLLQPIRHSAGLSLSDQGEGDLGDRMSRAFERWWPLADRILMTGTDAPGLDAQMLQHAAGCLDDADAVFVPAVDGGYALVGLRRPAPALFQGVPWSTDRVMHATRQHLAAAGLRHVELESLSDIDEPADLVHVPADWLA